MAFDGIATAALTKELSDLLTGGRIGKIAQTDASELVLTIRPMMEKGGGQVRLYLSADPSLPLCYLTEKTFHRAACSSPVMEDALRSWERSARKRISSAIWREKPV